MSNFMDYSNANSVFGQFANAIKNRILMSMLATKETSTTSSKAYAEGDYLILNNILYKVKTNIVSGGTIVISGNNANVAETTIGSELKNKQDDTGFVVKNGKLCVRHIIEE